eukprot:TRINITY_DN10140_c0_g1_i1.p1 TRINITY_DN10140_c0_g1~~TRINITY_DN10140_c0_g1_i1.p1  ORF type:complete len:199 (+),score=46.35 TRINITY_DN10140_c0_g1_i1:169-765(+)
MRTKKNWISIGAAAEELNGKLEEKYNFGLGTLIYNTKLSINCLLNPFELFGPPKKLDLKMHGRFTKFSYGFSRQSHNFSLNYTQPEWKIANKFRWGEKSWNLYSEIMIPQTLSDQKSQIVYGIGAGVGREGPIATLRASYCFDKDSRFCIGAGVTSRINGVIYFKLPFNIGINPCSILAFCENQSRGLIISLNSAERS